MPYVIEVTKKQIVALIVADLVLDVAIIAGLIWWLR